MLEIINIIVATAAAFAAGSVYYMKLAEPWMDASGVPRDENGQPVGGQNPMLYAKGFVCQLFVAGMMRHVFELSQIDTIGKGLISGIGIGLFFIAPWIALNNTYSMRPIKLTIIDGGYAAIACGVMGLVLTLF
ncbi:DUF1761 domain-containing protein [Aestuariibius sp. HNIBRBA575]|uniref:DUF1761 domain-containing protein n=1 Tax=Aestuariibius sp. HNIBRBA575 TaxID=3233343 RepID=UPI0034A20303